MNPSEQKKMVMLVNGNAQGAPAAGSRLAAAEPATEPGPSEQETAMGGGEMAVRFADGSSAIAKVRQLAIKEFPKLRSCLQDEVAMAALYCGKDAAWVEGLAVESHERIIVEGERMNRDFFGRWVEREKKREGLLPKLDAEMVASVLNALAKSNPEMLNEIFSRSGNGSPMSALKPA